LHEARLAQASARVLFGRLRVEVERKGWDEDVSAITAGTCLVPGHRVLLFCERAVFCTALSVQQQFGAKLRLENLKE